MLTYRTNSLFHYTASFSSMIDIVSTGKLYPNYCLEDLSTKISPNFYLGIPMVCFCDIPLSQASFMNHYGNYCIGFTKEWGIKKGCNPIQYITNDLVLDAAYFYVDIIKRYRKEIYGKENLSFGEICERIFSAHDIQKYKNFLLGFLKKYKGEWKCRTYCNYEENEWRYVIEDGVHDINWHYSQKEYLSWRGCLLRHKPHSSAEMKQMGLKFTLGDINHIVLKEESQIILFVKEFQKNPMIGDIKLSEEEQALLFSKLTSFERIRNEY